MNDYIGTKYTEQSGFEYLDAFCKFFPDSSNRAGKKKTKTFDNTNVYSLTNEVLDKETNE